MRHRLLIFSVFTVLTGCSGGSTGDTDNESTATPASIEVYAGNNQLAAKNAPVAIPPIVIVKDAGGNPINGVAVTFAVVTGGGKITAPTARTDVRGLGRVGSWTLGVSGTQQISATVHGLEPVTFSAALTASIAVTR